MTVLRRFGRRRWLALIASIVVAVPMAVSASSTATAGGQAAPQQSPTVDANYLYAQFYAMAKAYSYRISGADGDPRNAADPFNLPPTVNGWQEFYAYWKASLTDQRLDTPLAAAATVTDHYFRRTGGYRFDSDDAEVTIPGGS